MYRYLLFIALSCLANVALALDASLSYATFHGPQQNYVEVYLHLAGSSLQPTVVNDSTVRGSVNVTILFEKDGKVVKFDKFHLLGPEGAKLRDFVDVKRYALDNGEYQLKVTVEDGADPANVREYASPLKMNYAREGLQQSDIQLLASAQRSETEGPLVKNGLLLEPLPYHFYGRGANTLIFYHEIYHSDETIGDDFLVTYQVEKMENNQPKAVLIGHKRQTPAPVNPLLLQLDISRLASGNYQLAVEVRDRTQQLLSRRIVGFQRSNPLWDAEKLEELVSQTDLNGEFVSALSADELRYSLLALGVHLPQADVETVNLMLKDDKLNAQRMYLFSFWAKENPADPSAAYRKYMEVVRAVDKTFESGFRHGFETDRGYVYLKYGQPDDIVHQEEEPSAPPYEIWMYNNIERTNQNNVQFIFYNPSLAPGDYVLLHSDVIGERQNPQWQLELYRDDPASQPADYLQGTEVQDNFGRRAGRLIKQ